MRELAPTVGVGTNSVETATAFVEAATSTSCSWRDAHAPRALAGDALLPLCAERGVPVAAAGVFNSGLLAGGATFHYTAAPPELVAAEGRARADLRRHGVPLAAAALQFPSGTPR